MKLLRKTSLLLLAVLAVGNLASAQQPERPKLAAPGAQTSDRGRERLIKQIRHELVMLPYYGVFDNFSFRLDGGRVTLLGQVATPTLKTSAERVVKGIEGVEAVALLPQRPAKKMGASAGFHANQLNVHVRGEAEQLRSREMLPRHYLPALIHTYYMKARLT